MAKARKHTLKALAAYRRALPAAREYTCEVHEEVHATITLKVTARSAAAAAKLARHAWVTNAQGSLSEAVNERWVEVDGKVVDTSEEDE